MLVDSHCHLDYFEGEEQAQVIARARESGIGEMVTIGTRLGEQAAAVRDIAARHEGVWGTVGIHPHNAGERAAPSVEELLAEADHPRVIGLGESGLDYFYDTAPRAAQQEGFRQHIRAAQRSRLPLVVHARSADEDIAAILEEERARGGDFPFLLHCFSSGAGLARRAVAMGGYISFSGILTFPKSTEIRAVAAETPEDRILVETDSPYLAPVPLRGKRCEPAYVAHTARVLAQVRGIEVARAEAITTANFRRLFPQGRGGLTGVLRVTILGCGGSGGVPQIGGPDGRGDWGACDPAEPRNRRTRSAILVEGAAGGRLLVDAGPDLRHQLLAQGVERIDELLFTHSHADHVLGIDDLRQMNRILGRALPAHADAPTLENLRRRFDYAFLPAPPRGFFRPALEAREVAAGQVLGLAGLEVELFRQDHKVMDTLGLRIGRFAYSTDVVEMPEGSFGRLRGLDTWVVGCFQRAPHPVHAHVARVAEWAARLRPRRTVLTHMGPDLDWAWMREHLPAGLEPGFDGMVLEIP